MIIEKTDGNMKWVFPIGGKYPEAHVEVEYNPYVATFALGLDCDGNYLRTRISYRELRDFLTEMSRVIKDYYPGEGVP